jgi:hypothetical protein
MKTILFLVFLILLANVALGASKKKAAVKSQKVKAAVAKKASKWCDCNDDYDAPGGY